MIDLNTGFRALRTIAFVCFFASAAFGQSVLNFPARDLTRLVITNATPYAADVSAPRPRREAASRSFCSRSGATTGFVR